LLFIIVSILNKSNQNLKTKLPLEVSYHIAMQCHNPGRLQPKLQVT